MEYLDIITTNRNISINVDDLNAEKNNIDIKILVSDCLYIKTDVSKESIEEQKGNPYINKLIKGNRIISCEDDFKRIRTDNILFYNNLSSLCIFLLSDSYKGLIEELEKQSGYHHYTISSNHENLFCDQIETFKNDSSYKNWEFANRFLNPHHSIVIADPYLFKASEGSFNAIKELFKLHDNVDLKRKYHITLIGKKNDNFAKESDIKKWIIDLKAQFERQNIDIVIENFIIDKKDFHDRYIITNNSFIFSGYGIDIIKYNKQAKEGTWVAIKPFKQVISNGGRKVFYASIMKEKLSILKSWIIEQKYNEPLNPLLSIEFLKAE